MSASLSLSLSLSLSYSLLSLSLSLSSPVSLSLFFFLSFSLSLFLSHTLSFSSPSHYVSVSPTLFSVNQFHLLVLLFSLSLYLSLSLPLSLSLSLSLSLLSPLFLFEVINTQVIWALYVTGKKLTERQTERQVIKNIHVAQQTNLKTRRMKFQRIFLTKKRDENDVQKVRIRYFDVLHHQLGRYKEKLSLVHYTTLHYRFRPAFWSIKSFETSECESRIVGRSPCYDEWRLRRQWLYICMENC